MPKVSSATVMAAIAFFVTAMILTSCGPVNGKPSVEAIPSTQLGARFGRVRIALFNPGVSTTDISESHDAFHWLATLDSNSLLLERRLSETISGCGNACLNPSDRTLELIDDFARLDGDIRRAQQEIRKNQRNRNPDLRRIRNLYDELEARSAEKEARRRSAEALSLGNASHALFMMLSAAIRDNSAATQETIESLAPVADFPARSPGRIEVRFDSEIPAIRYAVPGEKTAIAGSTAWEEGSAILRFTMELDGGPLTARVTNAGNPYAGDGEPVYYVGDLSDGTGRRGIIQLHGYAVP